MSLRNTAQLSIRYIQYLKITKLKLQFSTQEVALHMTNVKEASLTDIECNINFGGLLISKSNVGFHGYVHINNNTRRALTSFRCLLGVHATLIVANNTNKAEKGDLDSTINISNTRMTLFNDSSLTVVNNTTSGCSGIKAITNSFITFFNQSIVNFLKNTGTNGGALALYDHSFLQFFKLSDTVTINFIENKAQSKGGAIFVEDLSYEDYLDPYYFPPIIICYSNTQPILNFTNNSAKIAGDEIYSGWIDWPRELVRGMCNSTEQLF